MTINDLLNKPTNELNSILENAKNTLNTSFNTYGNQVLLEDENRIWKELSEAYDKSMEEEKNYYLIKEILLTNALNDFQNEVVIEITQNK